MNVLNTKANGECLKMSFKSDNQRKVVMAKLIFGTTLALSLIRQIRSS
jgi:hypothetical protein